MAKDQSLVATHIPLLVRIWDISNGDVLEVGTGYFSTTILHWLSCFTKRHVYSYESRSSWYNRAKKYDGPYHHVIYSPDFDKADFDKRDDWGLVFIDHGPNTRRKIDIERLKDKCDYMVIHDTQPNSKNPDLPTDYCYTDIWPLFKYKYDYTKVLPWTSVVSNRKDLSNV